VKTFIAPLGEPQAISRPPRPHWTSEDEAARRKRRKSASFAAIRAAELNLEFSDRYGGMLLPDDDGGQDDVHLALHHLAETTSAKSRIRNWLRMRAPWFDDDDAIARILENPRKYRADQLAAEIGLTAERRARLGITTIGAIDLPAKARKKLRKAKNVEYQRALRRKAGAKPRAEYEAQSAERAKPWLELGMSRATWFRRRAAQE
jgi:hypothetical protein